MDRDQFDRLSRLIAVSGTRRDTLRLLVVGFALGANVEVASASARRRSHRNKQDQTRTAQPLQCTNVCLDCSSKKIVSGANLTRCDFNDQDLAGTRLRGSNLTDACFARANVRNASFRGANVSGTCFCGADLIGADFRGSNVTAAQLSCATVGCNTRLPNGKPAVPCAKDERCCDGVCQAGECGPHTCSGGFPVETGCSLTPPTCTCPPGTTCFQGLCCIPSGQPADSVPTFFCCSSTATAEGICCSEPFLGPCTSDAGCCRGTCDASGFCVS